MTPIAALDTAIEEGRLEADPAQREVARRLTGLADEIETWRESRKSLFRKSRPAPTGLYLWGGVGTGKSLMMDLFFRAAPLEKKKRVHFHAFMQDIHARLASERERRDRDPLPRVAAAVGDETRLLCFDEFQVTNVADAMILGRLFKGLFEAGVVIVATSNRHPDELYKNGINRQLFLPFIDMIKTTLDVVRLDAGRDYRLERLSAAPVYYAPLGPEADAAMDAAFDRLTMGAEPRSCTLTIQGRELYVPAEAAGVARFDFATLCEKPLGAADYLRLAETFDTVMIDHVPRLDAGGRDAAARFVTLIDALYEMKAKLVMSAEAEPDALYPAGDGAFEFQRTASRLMEMRSQDYLAARHPGQDEGSDSGTA